MLISSASILLLAIVQWGSIQGVVRTEGTMAPIPGAVVELPELGRRAITDERGIFVLPNVPAGGWRAVITALGHAPLEVGVEVDSAGAVRLEIELATRPIPLDPVSVEALRTRATPLAPAGPGGFRLGAEALLAIPTAAEPDIIRAVQVVPSVAAASDFSSAPYVRGGTPDQTMISLDGIPLFNPYHLGGLFGAVDPDLIQSVAVSAGAFGADTGDRLSGVIDMVTRDGGRDRMRTFGAIGLVSSRAGLEGPLPGRRGSYIVAARRTYLDALTRGAESLGLITQAIPYDFSDAQIKLVHDVGVLGRITATGYLNDEGLSIRPRRGTSDLLDLGFRWGSRAAGVTYSQPWGRITEVEAQGGWSRFAGRFDAAEYWDNVLQRRSTELSPLVEAETSMRNTYAGVAVTRHHARHQLLAGVQSDWYAFHYGVENNDAVEEFLPRFHLTTRIRSLSAYLEDEWAVSDALRIRGGLRVLDAGARGTAWMPRFGMSYAPLPRWSFTLGAGSAAQVMYSLHDQESIAASVIAYDQMAAVPEELGLTRAADVVLGTEWNGGDLHIRVEGYRKRFRALPLSPLPDDVSQALVIVPEDLREGSGGALGFELFSRYARGSSGLTVSYAHTRVDREIDGVRFTPRFERRHTLDLSGRAARGERSQLTARLVLASGQPYTPVVGASERSGHDSQDEGFAMQVLGEHNSARLPGYLRLDVGARRSYQRSWFGQAGTVTPYLSVLNVLNKRNVLFAQRQAGGTELVYAPQLPIFPTVGVEWKF
jgi:hypothetical protein